MEVRNKILVCASLIMGISGSPLCYQSNMSDSRKGFQKSPIRLMQVAFFLLVSILPCYIFTGQPPSSKLGSTIFPPPFAQSTFVWYSNTRPYLLERHWRMNQFVFTVVFARMRWRTHCGGVTYPTPGGRHKYFPDLLQFSNGWKSFFLSPLLELLQKSL